MSAFRETTGIREIDALLDRFRREESVYLAGADEDVPVEHFRRCTADNAYCHGVSDVLIEFLEENGVEAALTDEVDDDSFAADPEAMGYRDRSEGPSWHTAVIVYSGKERFLVDFTASQFGYKAFPLVQRFDEAGWQREW